jgi:flavin-dependent dehydrogenase
MHCANMLKRINRVPWMEKQKQQFDVAIIGAGLAGMAAAIHLADSGLKALCLEGEITAGDPVGESLDWSAPALLNALGLPMERLLEQGIATYKRHVILKLKDGSAQHYVPGDWLGKPPFNVNLQTMHVDRVMLNRALRDIVVAKGVVLVRDRVVHVETSGRRVRSIRTAQGNHISCRWYLDASGSATSLLPRLFGSPVFEYGPHKVAMWDYFPVEESIDGTTLHADGVSPAYMEWVWQIPIHPDAVSVGYVSTGESIKEKRQRGMNVRDIFRTQIKRFPDLQGLGPAAADTPHTTSFRCRVFSKLAGPNWLVMGESGSMVDPMTSNGVTAAMRHAAEASSLLSRFRNRTSLPYLPTSMYCRRIVTLARFFNSAIEKALYEWPIRNRIGPFRAGDLYTIPAWSLNVLYSRLRPRGLFKTMLFSGLVSLLRIGIHIFYAFCRWSDRFPPSLRTSPNASLEQRPSMAAKT